MFLLFTLFPCLPDMSNFGQHEWLSEYGHSQGYQRLAAKKVHQAF